MADFTGIREWLNITSPFYFEFNDHFEILHLGRLAQEFFNIETHSNLLDSFRTDQSPFFNKESISQNSDKAIVLIHKKTNLKLVGYYKNIRLDGFVMICQPRFDSMKKLNELGLTISDFSPADPTVDFLFFMQTQELMQKENKTYVEKIKNSHCELKKINDELEQFAYRTSHDLKAPITASKRLAQYIEDDINENNLSEAKQNSNKIFQLMEGLEILIQDILLLVKSDKKIDEVESVNILKVIETIENRLSLSMEQRKCKVLKQIGGPAEVLIEKNRLTQIIENLVSNGIKYSDSLKNECFVKIKITNNEDNLEILVEDNGIGIPAKYKDDVFKMFKRFNPELGDGSGLGMSIVKKHIEYMNGEIEFSSSDAGTIFKVILPVCSQKKEGTE